jgi:hypothetical protein
VAASALHGQSRLRLQKGRLDDADGYAPLSLEIAERSGRGYPATRMGYRPGRLLVKLRVQAARGIPARAGIETVPWNLIRLRPA